MKNYKVIVEIDLSADTPLEAAKKLEDWIKGSDRFTYVVQDDTTNEIVSVDLAEGADESVLPHNDYSPFIIHPVNMVECEGCNTEIPETDLYCNNCGNENF